MANKKKKPKSVVTLIKAIKATVAANTVLPILEDVRLTGETAEITDLEIHVIVPFKTNVKDVCLPARRLTDALELMDEPVITQLPDVLMVEPHFKVEGVTYGGTEETYEEMYAEDFPSWQQPREDDSQEEKDAWKSWEQWIKERGKVLEGAPQSYMSAVFAADITEGKRKVSLTGDNIPRIQQTLIFGIMQCYY